MLPGTARADAVSVSVISLIARAPGKGLKDHMDDSRLDLARRLMVDFATASGITGDRPPRRYLWTDAHAVCNYLALADATGEAAFRQLAVQLAAQVHDVLGRYRDDDVRTGWLSGLDDAEGRRHPTAGGLRIGKPLPERRREAMPDPQAEWEQDGQYYHYLTKWMHALRQLSAATRERSYLSWARELAVAAHGGFRARSGPPRLYWKMSTDLSYPLVPSSGLHDPLDGLVTALTLFADSDANRQLEDVVSDLHTLCVGHNWATDDPLGIGGLLFDAGRLLQLSPNGRLDRDPQLPWQVLEDADRGLASFARSAALGEPAAHRLAFRELGLAIGLQTPPLVEPSAAPAERRRLIDRVSRYRKLGLSIERFWTDPRNRTTETWRDHQDINDVMLATSLLPGGLLILAPLGVPASDP